jgi:hypothetical protein
MKMMVKLAVLLATFLLLTGVAFAQEIIARPCFVCYEVTVTDLDDPTHTHTGCVGISFCSGEMISPFGTDIVEFFDAMKEQALGYSDSDPSCVGYFKFHGDWQYIITGIGYCEGERHKIRGHQIDCSTPGCPSPG